MSEEGSARKDARASIPQALGPLMPHRRSARTGFTLVELMVAVGILAIMIVGIGTVFRAASQAAGTTAADTTVIDGWGVLDTALRQDLAHHLDTPKGLLIIHSEWVPNAVEAKINGQPVGVPRPARADRLAFVARGHYESATAREMPATIGRGTAAKQITTSVSTDAALIYYGHGQPAEFNAAGNLVIPADTPNGFVDLPRADWTLCRRATLLGVPPEPNPASPVRYPNLRPQKQIPPGIPPGKAPALPISNTNDPLFDLVNNRIDGIGGGLPDFLFSLQDPVTAGVPPLFNAVDAQNNQGVYYMRPMVPRRVNAGTYRRAFPIMLENVGDFIVEWTDGSVVDPRDADGDGQADDRRVQWFGMPRDANGDGAITFPVDGPPFSGDTLPKSVWLGGPDGQVTTPGDNFGEFGDILAYWDDISPGAQARGEPDPAQATSNPSPGVVPIEAWGASGTYYHASWFSTNYPSDYLRRPTAFRILVRLYDAELRVEASERDQLPTTVQFASGSAPSVLPAGSDRYGSQYTIVAP